MIRNLLLAALSLATVAGMHAQETLYLVKDNAVVGKYSVADIDYATFSLPAGVTDPDTPAPGIISTQFVGAVASYFGTTDGVADYMLTLSTRPIWEETKPVTMLYLQFSGNAADYKNLALEPGTYTLGDANSPAPFKFYAGQTSVTPSGTGVSGSAMTNTSLDSKVDYKLVTDGSFKIEQVGTGYSFSGMLKLEEGDILEFSYSGPCIVENDSEEKDPAEEVPLPESALTSDVQFKPLVSECYGLIWKDFFADMPGYDYVNIQLYGDSNYASNLQVVLLVKSADHQGVALPKGVYAVKSKESATDLCAISPFIVKSDTGDVLYGNWLTQDFIDVTPLVSGEVEVLEDVMNLNSGTVKLRINLKDNAAQPHSVTATFEGRLYPL